MCHLHYPPPTCGEVEKFKRSAEFFGWGGQRCSTRCVRDAAPPPTRLAHREIYSSDGMARRPPHKVEVGTRDLSPCVSIKSNHAPEITIRGRLKVNDGAMPFARNWIRRPSILCGTECCRSRGISGDSESRRRNATVIPAKAGTQELTLPRVRRTRALLLLHRCVPPWPLGPRLPPSLSSFGGSERQSSEAAEQQRRIAGMTTEG